MQSTFKNKKEIRSIRSWLVFFMTGLFLSGLTAIPVEQELAFLTRLFSTDTAMGSWLYKVYAALAEANKEAPFLAYGYDWLAFAHFILAILFIGAFRDPVRNKWVIEFGMIACWAVVPFALAAGYYRSIPLGWRFIDCLFGVAGLIPLTICYKKISRIEAALQKG
ncbi:MAG TPA: hypothetical protein VHN59_04625 [Chitinophagaceae bacterium]|nr:hypothetical protein [Chitinophagaceae bacterium]